MFKAGPTVSGSAFSSAWLLSLTSLIGGYSTVAYVLNASLDRTSRANPHFPTAPVSTSPTSLATRRIPSRNTSRPPFSQSCTLSPRSSVSSPPPLPSPSTTASFCGRLSTLPIFGILVLLFSSLRRPGASLRCESKSLDLHSQLELTVRRRSPAPATSRPTQSPPPTISLPSSPSTSTSAAARSSPR